MIILFQSLSYASRTLWLSTTLCHFIHITHTNQSIDNIYLNMVCINGSSDNKLAECFALFSAPTLKSINSNMHTYTYIYRYNCT